MPTDELKQQIAMMKEAAKKAQRLGDSSLMFPECHAANVLALIAEIERLQLVVDAAVEWRRVGYERQDEFAYRIGPLLDAIDIYDVGHKRPCEGL